jgi:hypothetical protein
MRVSFVLLMVVLAVTVAGVAWLFSDTDEIYVASHDLPAYHQVVEDDVRLQVVTAPPGGGAVAREVVLGRYTLAAVEQDEPFRLSALGPALANGALDGLGLVSLEPSVETSLAGNLGRGDRVDVLLSATGLDRVSTSTMLTSVLVVDVRGMADGEVAVVLGLSRQNQQSLLASVGTSRVLVVRTTAYRRP